MSPFREATLSPPCLGIPSPSVKARNGSGTFLGNGHSTLSVLESLPCVAAAPSPRGSRAGIHILACWGEGAWAAGQAPGSPLQAAGADGNASCFLASVKFSSKAVATQSAKVCVTPGVCSSLGGCEGRVTIARLSVWGQVGPWEDREDGEDPWGPLAVRPPLICVPVPSSLRKLHLLAQTPRTEGPGGSGASARAADHAPLCLPFKAAPSAPGRVLASRDTKTSVVVQWDRPRQDEDLLGYYVDCCVAGSNLWEPCNHKPIGYNRCRTGEPQPTARGSRSGSRARTRGAR